MFGLLYGHRRLLAHRKLNLLTIKARVFDGLSREFAELIVLTENLRREELSYLERVAWTKRWLELQTKGRDSPPSDDGTTQPETNKAKAPSATKRKSKPKGVTPQEDRKRHREAIGQLIKETGLKKSAIYGLERTGKAFKDDQLIALSKNKAVTFEIVQRLVKLDEPSRDKAAHLIAAGLPPQEAIEAVQLAAKVAVEHDGKVDVVPAEEPVVVIPDPVVEPPELPRELTDEEWLDAECGKRDDAGSIRGRIRPVKLDQFDREAITYRRHIERLRLLVGGLHRDPSLIERSGYDGQLVKMLADIFLPTHPKRWPVCRVCEGTGTLFPKGFPKCRVCKGTGTLFLKEWLKCRECEGTGDLNFNSDCPLCRGVGLEVGIELDRLPESHVVDIEQEDQAQEEADRRSA